MNFCGPVDVVFTSYKTDTNMLLIDLLYRLKLGGTFLISFMLNSFSPTIPVCQKSNLIKNNLYSVLS